MPRLNDAAILRARVCESFGGSLVEAACAVDVPCHGWHVPVPEALARGDQPLLPATILGTSDLPAPPAQFEPTTRGRATPAATTPGATRLHDLLSVAQAGVARLDPRAWLTHSAGHAEPPRDSIGTQSSDQVCWRALSGTSGLPTLLALLEAAIAEGRAAFSATLGMTSVHGVFAAIEADVARLD